MPFVELVADRVVLAHEERVQEREADPEVAGDSREIDVLLQLLRRQALLVDLELAVLARAERGREGGVAAVDLGAVPPVRVVGDVRERLVRVGARVRVRPRDLHRVLGPGVVVGDRDLPRLLRRGLAVAEPVVHLELDPGSGEQVERRRGLELLAGQELAADQARARVEHRVGRLPIGERERHVAAEAAPEAAHQRVVEVVERSVEGACRQVAVVVVDRWHVERSAARVVEVLVAQPLTEADQGQKPGWKRELVPADAPVERVGRAAEERGERHYGSPFGTLPQTSLLCKHSFPGGVNVLRSPASLPSRSGDVRRSTQPAAAIR